VQDIRNFARKHEDPAIRALTERPANVKEAKIIIPYANRRYVFNFYGTAGSDRTQRNYLIDVSQKAFEDLAGKLSEWRPAHEPPLDNNWTNYLYGDITDPNNGIMVDTVSIPSNPQPFNGFIFTSGSHKSTKGVRQYPVPPEALTGRYQLYGDQSAFKIMQPQEIVDFLVEDGAIPYHLIQEVCSHYCNVPAPPSRAKVFPGTQDEGLEDDDIPPFAMPVSNKAPAPPPVIAAPPPQAAVGAPAKKYWMTMDGSIFGNTLISFHEAQNIIMSNPANVFMVSLEGTNTWQDAIEAGFSVPPKPSAPPPMPPPPPPLPTPTPPAFTLPSIQPTAAPVIQQKQATEETKVVVNAEEEAEMNAIRIKFESNTATTQEISKYMQYIQRVASAK
jgi:hypothetical protein